MAGEASSPDLGSEDKGPTIVAVASMFWVFAFGLISLRLWSMRLQGRKMLLHDILIVVGFVRVYARRGRQSPEKQNLHVLLIMFRCFQLP